MIVGVIDVGLGNIKSVIQAFKLLGNEVILVDSPDKITQVDTLILPGVGAFADGMTRLEKHGLIDPINDYVSNGGFILGICLGMQLLFEKSFEFGEVNGLGLLEGQVIKFDESYIEVIPHIGWNTLSLKKDEPIFSNIEDKSHFYFVHSFYADIKNSCNIIGKTTYYDKTFCSAVRKGNIYGFQFHPEKK